MSLTDKARAELERRGPDNIRALLTHPNMSGGGQGASVNLESGGSANRGDVETWLREKDIADEKVAADWHAESVSLGRQSVNWAKAATWAAVIAAAITLLSLIRDLMSGH